MNKIRQWWSSKFVEKNNIRYLIYALAIFLIMSLGYSLTGFIPRNPIYIDMEIDSKIPFIPSFIYAYFNHYFMPIISLWLISFTSKKSFKIASLSMLIGSIICHITYLFLDVCIIRPEFEVKSITTWLLNAIYFLDPKASNCLPSLHALFGFATLYNAILAKNLKWYYKAILGTGGLLTAISTTFIKQHYFIDVAISFILITVLYILITFIINIYYKKIGKEN